MSAAPQIEFPIHARDEFYMLEEFSNLRHEFHDGVIVPRWGNNPRHARIVGETTCVLGNLLENHPCFAVPNDQMIRVEDADMDAYPDVVVYCEDAEFDSRFE